MQVLQRALLITIPALFLATAATAQDHFSALDVFNLEYASDPQISRDGTEVVVDIKPLTDDPALLAKLEALCSEMSDVTALRSAGVTSRDADVLEQRLDQVMAHLGASRLPPEGQAAAG